MQLVNVVIPCYRKEITPLERMSLNKAFEILGRYPITIIKPESLDLNELKEAHPTVNFESFADHYFDGCEGYNSLMLSTDFYRRFLNFRYILIYQLDAYVFNDHLTEWCNKGYDYIGAPWLQRPIYRLPVIKQWIKFSVMMSRRRGERSKHDLYDKVGNGGLSLRRVSSHIKMLVEHQNLVNHYLNQRHNLYNEDVFWATEPKDFRYPTAEEALSFSFDRYPLYCLKLTDGEMPFGCHAWYRKDMRKFWQPIIGFKA